jgi:hypothetical protein
MFCSNLDKDIFPDITAAVSLCFCLDVPDTFQEAEYPEARGDDWKLQSDQTETVNADKPELTEPEQNNKPGQDLDRGREPVGPKHMGQAAHES